jgi:hypothetical protein
MGPCVRTVEFFDLSESTTTDVIAVGEQSSSDDDLA